MSEIISFGYNEDYVVDESFDLNQLRKLRRTKKVGNVRTLDESNNNITVKFGATITIDEEVVNDELLQETKESLENYRKWYHQEQEKVKNLNADIDCIKQQINELKGEHF
jgi:phosphopantetheine adenylyltransferase